MWYTWQMEHHATFRPQLIERKKTHVFPTEVRPTRGTRDVGDNVHTRQQHTAFRSAGRNVNATLEQKCPPAMAVEALKKLEGGVHVYRGSKGARR